MNEEFGKLSKNLFVRHCQRSLGGHIKFFREDSSFFEMEFLSGAPAPVCPQHRLLRYQSVAKLL